MSELVGLESVRRAREVTARHLHVTPLFSSLSLGRRIGAEAWLKAELFQKTGSFKPRGALTRLASLSAEERERGVITVSAGNHAQGVAFAARAHGVPATVVMPENASRLKADGARSYGAEVILHGSVQDLFPHARKLQAERGLTFVHPFDDPEIVAGHGTIGLEIVEQLPEVATVVVPVGGGGLLAGVAVSVKRLRPRVRVIGVEPQGACPMRLSLDAGRTVKPERISTIADGLSAPIVGELNHAVAAELVDDVVLIPDEAILEGLRFLWSFAKLAAEPAGSASVGALLSGAVDAKGPVVAIVSGGNVDAARLKEWL